MPAMRGVIHGKTIELEKGTEHARRPGSHR